MSPAERAPLWAPWRWEAPWQVLLGITLGGALGYLSGAVFAEPVASLSGRWDMQIYDLFGTLFMRGLKMLIVPLVASAIISSLASVGQLPGFGRMGAKTLAFYLGSSLLAILVGLTLVNLIRPGGAVSLTAAEAVAAAETAGSAEAGHLERLAEHTEGRGVSDILHVFVELLPENIFAAAAQNRMLGLIVFSLLFGYFMSRLEGERRTVMVAFWEGLHDVFMGITDFILRFLPLGVLCLIAQTTAKAFADGNASARLGQLGAFAATVLLGLAIHALVTLPLLLHFFARVSPRRHARAMAPAMMTAFSTASSAATLPVTLETVEGEGVSKRVASFVLPVGATINMDGTALYECVAVLFLAQLSGVELDTSHQFLVVTLALLTSVGVAGIPSASLVAIVIILNAVNDRLPAGQHIPEAALALILVFDRLLDMCRTAVNVFGDSCAALVIARSEGESPLSEDGDRRSSPSVQAAANEA